MFTEVSEALVGATNPELDDRLRALELRRRAVDAEIAATVAVATQRMVHLTLESASSSPSSRRCSWSTPSTSGSMISEPASSAS